MWFATAFETKKTLSRLVSISSRQVSSGKFSRVSRRWMPVLLTRMSIEPASASNRSIAALTALLSVTSNAASTTVAPSARRVSAAAANFSTPRPLRTTVAPAAARPRASAKPIPWLDPVISAVRPCKLNISSVMRVSLFDDLL
jgi:hypothetical protein